MIGSLCQSGLGSIDEKSKYKALRIPLIQRIIQGKGWNDVITEYFESLGALQFLLRCNYDTAYLKWIPQFYELLDYFKTIKYAYNGECIIWNNKHIPIEDKSIFWKDY